MTLPAGLPGEWNVVIVAFRRQQQELVDSWVPWLEERAAVTPWLRFAELPAIGLQWRAARPVIDGGMAAAIRDQQTRRRTLTVYTDLRRVTAPLGISDRNTIWLFLVGRAGRVRWRGSGGWDPATAAGLGAALDGLPEHTAAAASAAGPGAGQFEMSFDPRFRLPLATLGVTPATAHVTVTADRLVACFGPWTCRTTPANVRAVDVTGPYRWYRAIGPRLLAARYGVRCMALRSARRTGCRCPLRSRQPTDCPDLRLLMTVLSRAGHVRAGASGPVSADVSQMSGEHPGPLFRVGSRQGGRSPGRR